MWLPLLLSIISVGVLVLLVKNMRASMIETLKELVLEEREIEEKYLFTQRRNRELKKEFKDMEVALTLLKNDLGSIPAPSEADPEETEEEETERVSQYMLSKGLITAEQNEKALDKMSILSMDFLGICLTLGYIDLEKAKGIVKTLELHQSPLSAEK